MARLHLTPVQIQTYQREGWLVPDFRLDPAFVTELQDALNELIRNNPGVRPEKLVSAHVEGDKIGRAHV